MSPFVTRLSLMLARTEILCPRCCHAIDPQTIGAGERVFWCGHCRAVRDVPLFRIPGWLAGTMLVLVLNGQRLL